ncbi:TIGR02099 family protein [Vibrio xiamenensis]|uniref:TIGR02099 family protein n=1 Tax=Vibrio xiamenensis TaxID=861298 RepID=A0A1G8BTE9_9VIBR|nr:YhdP family protein [Vibrio xiamenensis]SDH36363.1 TIGR02099 family protein [Vibrio xiamenensis]
MSSTATRASRFLLWLLVIVLVTLAIAVTTLRIALPKLNHFQSEIQTLVTKVTGMDMQIENISGFWRNTHPSVSLQGIRAKLPKGSDIKFAAASVDVEFDLIDSVLQMQPVIAELNIHKLGIDVSSVDFFSLKQKEPNDEQNPARTGIDILDNLFLRQLDSFSLIDANVIYKGVDEDVRRLKIDKLKWRNLGRRHLAEGIVSIADSNLNSLSVSADFTDHGSLMDVSGEFYASADNISVTPWLTRYLKDQTGIKTGEIGLSSWVTLDHSQPVNAYVDLKPSQLVWQEGQQHELNVESGVFQLSPYQNGWRVSGHSLKLRTDDTPWPDLDLALDYQPDKWALNVSQLDLAAITPLVKLAPDSKKTSDLLEQFKLGGQVEDLRVSMGKSLDSLRYSAQLENGSMAQWQLLPELHHLSAHVAGNMQKAGVQLSLIDDTLPYGDVFQAPLNIKQGQVDLVWQRQSDGWSLWADKITAATPDLQVLGAFRLDFPQDKSPFLSFYAEADLYNAGETWRYLPSLALGRSLTDYLSSAIQGGKVDTAKLLWYGELGDFPYKHNEGVFQAWVGLEHGQFSFDTAWPPITDLQMNLLFQNDSMYLDSQQATLKDVHASRIKGQIPELAEDGHLKLEATTTASGKAVRDYMTATPLVDSVGAALTAVQVEGDVQSSFQLDIPLNGDEPRAWGYAELKDNHVDIDAPPMSLESVSGKIEFDNDVVTAAGLSAQLLDQPISVDFKGESAKQGYTVGIDLLGDWDVKPLAPYIGKQWTTPLSGHAPWRAGVKIQLNDVGFTYQIDSSADLRQVASRYPYPLNKALNSKGKAVLQASGNQERVAARLELPNAKYQADIDIGGSVPVLKATNLVLGKGSFKISPVVGHHAQVRLKQFNIDSWLDWYNSLPTTTQSSASTAKAKSAPSIEVPLPERVDMDVKELSFMGIDWNDVNATARKKSDNWSLDLDSQEIKGQIQYSAANNDTVVNLSKLHLYIPQLEDSDTHPLEAEHIKQPLATQLEKDIYHSLTNITLKAKDFWLQGYKVGNADVKVVRQADKIELKKMAFSSGSNQINIDGSWQLSDTLNQSQFNLSAKGDNNSDLMERFGIASGIQKAPFELNTSVNYQGSPWAMRVNTLAGKVKTKLGKGVISDVSGAAKLLGLFSLDSIIRKMQLDFSDVFDKGMAFNSITGSGEIRDGIFVTNNIEMDAVAGEMTIKGLADLNKRTVDAEVNFVPDITSGIPVLTAFAVTPTTALYVLAITTVISPVVEVFTQVNYEVKGPLDSPTVKELSRSRGEFKLPEKLRKEAEATQ